MLRIFFLCLLVLSFCAGCEEEEELKPRRKAKPGAGTEDTFIGSYTADSSSLDPCPNGPGAELKVDFVNVQMTVKIPERDKALNFSQILADANSAIQPDGSPTLNNQTSAFSGAFTISDPDENFNADACLNAGDTYAFRIRLSIAGTIVGNSVQNATYEISNVCANNSVTPSICSGSFSGSKSN